VVSIYWKVKTSSLFKRFKETIRKEKLVKEKSQIEGAYIMIDDLKG
jgi:hypothetical protein